MKSHTAHLPLTANHKMCALFYDTTALIKQIDFSELDDVVNVLSVVKENIHILENDLAKDIELGHRYKSDSGSSLSFIAENLFGLNDHPKRLLFSGKY